jgi:hypothetical protein
VATWSTSTWSTRGLFSIARTKASAAASGSTTAKPLIVWV